MSQGSSLRAVLYALAANAGILIAKGTAAALTGSSAMLAEAIHSAADCGNQVLLLLGLKDAKRAPDAKHPLGYGRVVYFWAFLVAALLFTLGGMFSIYEGWHKLDQAQAVSSPAIAIGVLLVAIILEGFSLAGCIREIRKVSGSRTLWRFFRTSRNSELIVVLGEDIAALAGLAFALMAIGIALWTGNPMFDAIGSMAVGVLLVVVAILLSVEIKAMITGESAEAATERAIRDFLLARPELAELYNLISLQIGDGIMLAIKARMKENASATKLIGDINRVEADLRAAFPAVRWCFFEPDTRN
ncbi:MAG TPA: cation diffusion facilitator family transporter [Rhodanobacteraceae bacterium]|nr:cation diffusion facilitator family transporter [Rhodanobacteraceae bacterium]